LNRATFIGGYIPFFKKWSYKYHGATVINQKALLNATQTKDKEHKKTDPKNNNNNTQNENKQNSSNIIDLIVVEDQLGSALVNNILSHKKTKE
jgi:hypothetical protein